MSIRPALPTVFPTPCEAPWRALRWLPFIVAAGFSIAVSALAPEGRHGFHIDWNIDLASIEFSVVKAPHIGATVMLAMLGVLATGRRAWIRAFALTVLVGAAWELGQSTVIGHQARLSDLAPDALGALAGCVLGAAGLWATESGPIGS